MTNTYLDSKPRYEILDGLRGVAAMLVVAFHLFETYSKGPTYQIINHGYLAVDFFFVLSGFVVGYAYHDRWGRMSLTDFFKRRIVRLHPMVVVGTLIGALLYYFGDAPMFGLIKETPWWQVLLMTLLGLTMIPAKASMDIRGWTETYPLNGAQWSLMLEYIANIVYATVLRRCNKMVLGILTVIAAAYTLNLGLGLGVLGSAPAYNGTFIGGWGIEGWQLHIGLVRLAYPFLIGLLLSQMGKHITIRGGFWWCALMITVILGVPRIGGSAPENFWMNGLYETVCVLAIFPLIVSIGAGSRMTDATSRRVCKFLGDLSYPLYITHYPLIYVQMAWAASHKDAPTSMHIFVAIALFMIAVSVAYGMLKLYDEPVREWLKNHWLKRTRKQ